MKTLHLAVSLLILPFQLMAAPGHLDPTFGNGGQVLTDIGPRVDAISEIAFDANGAIIAAGRSQLDHASGDYADWAIAKYSKDGILDPFFGNAGSVVNSFGKQQGRISDLLVQPDGKILVTGWNRGELRGANIGLGRYLPNGTLDSTFGTNGLALISLGVQHSYTRKVLPLADGRFLVIGHTRNNPDGTTRRWFNPLMMRFHANGTLDKSFGNQGVQIIRLKDREEVRVYCAGMDAQKRIIATGYYNFGLEKSLMISRLNEGGGFDLTFQQPNSPMPGVVKYDLNRGQDEAWSIVSTSDGGILVGGQTFTGNDFDFLLIKLDAQGVPDAKFGVNGVVTTPIGYGDDTIRSLALQKDGKILAAGECTDPFGPGSNNIDFCLARYTPEGKLDEGFGNFERFPGTSVFDFGKPLEVAHSVQVQSDGKIILAGESQFNGAGQFALARILP